MNRASIEYVLSAMHVKGPMKQNKGWFTVSCPLAPWTHAHGVDQHPSFGVHESVGTSGVNCFSCGFSGGMLSLVREYGHYALPAGLISEEELAQLTDYVLLAEDEDTLTHEERAAIVDMEIAAQLEPHLGVWDEYMEQRGITPEMMHRWRLGFVASYFHDRTGFEMTNRLLFPIYEVEQGHMTLRGMTGRSTCGEEPKYKNAPPNLSKTDYLYGSWLHEGQTKAVIVEGPIDCVMLDAQLRAAGMQEFLALALLGSAPSARQIDWLRSNMQEVVCMLDNDPSGKLGVKRLIDALEAYVVVTVVEWQPAHKDPADAGELAIAMIQGRNTVLKHRLAKKLGGLLGG